MRPTFAQKKDHLYSAVSLTFTVRNVRAANRMWAEALVKDILGEQEVPKDNARPKYVVNKTSPWWERDNNAGIYDGVYELPVFTERPCGVAENMARALKSTNNMRPTFRWASVVLTIDNAEDTYVDCGFSPVEIFFIVVGSLLAFVLLCALIFNVGFRRRGSCGGNPNGTCIGCYGGLACCSLCPGFLGILFCCCSFCPCKKENNKGINKNSSKKPPMLSNVSPQKSSAKKKGGLCGCCSNDKKQKVKSDNKLLSKSKGSSKEAKEKESNTSEIALSTLSSEKTSEKKKKRKTVSNNPMVNATPAPATAAPATAAPAMLLLRHKRRFLRLRRHHLPHAFRSQVAQVTKKSLKESLKLNLNGSFTLIRKQINVTLPIKKRERRNGSTRKLSKYLQHNMQSSTRSITSSTRQATINTKLSQTITNYTFSRS